MQHSPASSRSGRGDRCTNLQLDWLLDSSLQETDRDKEGPPLQSRVHCSHPGVVFMKQRADEATEVEHSLLKEGFDPGEFPDSQLGYRHRDSGICTTRYAR